VHTCNKSGCHEAKHVQFRTLSGFETCEGAPAEQNCTCTVSNHHLRGYGKVRWEGEVAIIECDGEDDGEALINGAAYRDDAKKSGEALEKAKDQIKRLKERRSTEQAAAEELRKKLAATETAKADLEDGPVRQLGIQKIKYTVLDGQYKALLTKHQALKAEFGEQEQQHYRLQSSLGGEQQEQQQHGDENSAPSSPPKRRRSRRAMARHSRASEPDDGTNDDEDAADEPPKPTEACAEASAAAAEAHPPPPLPLCLRSAAYSSSRHSRHCAGEGSQITATAQRSSPPRVRPSAGASEPLVTRSAPGSPEVTTDSHGPARASTPTVQPNRPTRSSNLARSTEDHAMTRITTISLAATTLLLAGCYSPRGGIYPYSGGGYTYVSSEMRPVTIAVVDTRTEKPFFKLEIPAGKQLTMNFLEGEGDDPVERPDRMVWSIWDAGTSTALANGGSLSHLFKHS
jgi:hypothetical protein